MKDYSMFKIQIELPDGSKQFVWSKIVEGDIQFDRDMDKEVARLEESGHKVAYSRRAIFGSKALYDKGVIQ